MLAGTWEDRLKDFLSRRCYQRIEGTEVEIIEEHPEGRVCVRFILPAPVTRCIHFQIERVAFDFLEHKKAADGLLLVERSPGLFEVYVLECKLTIDGSKWREAW